jgi:deoxyribodipyrimidine photo-lyase
MGWQWAAGSGADAAPYFRIFNPVLQGERFDKQGAYVKKFVPELKDVEPKYIHKPWELAPIEAASISGYPEPVVDLKESRQEALARYQAFK